MRFARGLIRSRVLLLAVVVLAPVAARAQDEATIQRGLQYLRGHYRNEQIGETALTALAMIKADVPKEDPDLAACIAKIRTRVVSSAYDPQRRGGHDIYEAAVVAMALSNLDAEARRFELQTVAQYLVSKQKANGSWDYDNRVNGDTSISQYAILGLWEAENGGATVPPQVWDRAAAWYLTVQAPGGSWTYHRDEAVGSTETISMTAAGVGSLLICQRQLARHRRGGDTLNPLLQPLAAEGSPAKYDVTTPAARVNQAVGRGMTWLGANFTTTNSQIIGASAYYGLYGIERLGALADKQTLGRVNWFDLGRQYITTTQKPDGCWDSAHGQVPNTVWALLFVTKSTAKTIRRVEIKRLGAGTLLGGRGLPKDLTNLTVAGGRVVSRPMNGAVEGMLAVLEDPRSDQAEAALSGLIARYRTEGPAVLKPHKDRFRKLLTDRDPGLRRVAVWAMARTADLDVAPLLIERLTDADEAVVITAREGLQLLSRKIEGLGPPSPSTPQQRAEAAERWRAWYAGIRPLDLEGQDDDEKAAPPRGGPR
jgi:hypothetical protein